MRVTRRNDALRADFVEAVRREHGAIVEAIAAGNAALARRRAMQHMRGGDRRMRTAAPITPHSASDATMNILITGGAGFVGSRLARHLLERGRLDGRAIERLVLADQVAPRAELAGDKRVEARVGPLLGQCEALGREGFDGVFHLASAVSGECEADFDLGLRSNLDTTRALLDALRAATRRASARPSSSSPARWRCSGRIRRSRLPDLVGDDTLPAPKTSYGTHKLICEHLIADYSRKGFVDGRSARLMTVTVRPGRPNGAASSFFSGIIREPLAGVESICPVGPEVSHPLTSVARTVEGLVAVYEASIDALGGRLALNLPAVTTTVAQMLDALEAVAGKAVRAARALRSRRDDRRHRRQLVARRHRRARRAARPARRSGFRFHHSPVHRRLPRRAGRRRRPQGTRMNQIDLKGRVAVVTGGAQGIGYAIAERMLASGASVVLWDADAGKLAEAKASLAGKGSVATDTVELTNEAAVDAAARRVVAAQGKIDIVVNNAGITGGNATTWELAPDVWRRVIEVNLVAPYLVCRAVVPHMLAAKYGRIVNIASIAGKEGNPNASHYSASKAGLIALTKSLGKELAGKGIVVNAITPAAAKTAMFATMTQQHIDYMLSKIPMGRFLEVDEAAAHGRLAVVGGMLVHDRLGGRHFRRPRHLLIR